MTAKKISTTTSSFAPPILFLLFDYLGVVLSEHLAFVLRDALDTWNRVTYLYADTYIYGWVPLLFLIFLGQSRTYRQMKPVVDTMREIFQSVFAGWIASIIIIYFLKASNLSSRLFIILFGLFVLINVCVIRYVVLKFLKRRNIFYEPIILIGAGKTAERLIKFWAEDLGYRYKIVGLIDDCPVSKILPRDFRILGGFDEARSIIRAAQIKTVVIAAPGLDKERLQELINRIQPYVKNISFVPDLIGTPMSSAELSILFSEKI
ncbi:MAG: undecaprenyl-phosphate galactose phosphotransferase WbaP, partial [Selenomonadaceae bacterium]|nr:undecaprenyl-phosphate galactose phosphotransferase WbaP [Selenomonadaceae bacterium]